MRYKKVGLGFPNLQSLLLVTVGDIDNLESCLLGGGERPLTSADDGPEVGVVSPVFPESLAGRGNRKL